MIGILRGRMPYELPIRIERGTKLRTGLFAFCLLASAATADAAIIYEFQQDRTGDVLATMEFSALPATETEVVSLVFTPAGDAFFGLGESYDGTFDSSAKSFVDDGTGILVSSEPTWGANIEDTNPEEASTLIGDLAWVLVGTSNPGKPVDVIYLESADFQTRIFGVGSFVRIPEPSAFALLTIAASAARQLRRSRP